MKNETRHKLEALSHLIVGILLFTKGYDKLSHHFVVTGIIIMAMSLFIFGYFIYLLRIKKVHDKKLELLVHLAEGIALLFTTYVYWETGKKYLPYATGVAGIAYLVVAVVRWRKKAA